MNIYEDIKSLNSKEFSVSFTDAENQREEISNIIFDTQKITEFNCEYQIFTEQTLSVIFEAIEEILCDEGYVSLCCAMYYFMKNDISIDALKPYEDGSLKSEFALIPPLIANMADFCKDAEKRGVDKEILSKTLSAVDMYINSNVRRKGRIGTSGYHSWLPRYAKGKLFRLGAFQFELRTFNGENVIGVHIPNGTKLDVRENLINFRYALEFFGKYYTEYDFIGFNCFSWLLNPHIEEIMMGKTNITRFGDMFERFELEKEEEGVFISVFKVPSFNTIDELCEDTSLQRNIKKFLKDGNKFKDYGGFISMERLQKLCAEFDC